MEQEYFSWSDWDELDTMVFMFYDVTLNRDIGNFKTGTKFSSAIMDYEKGKLTLWTEDDGETEFPMHIVI